MHGHTNVKLWLSFIYHIHEMFRPKIAANISRYYDNLAFVCMFIYPINLI
jgi:hypothetical protein